MDSHINIIPLTKAIIILFRVLKVVRMFLPVLKQESRKDNSMLYYFLVSIPFQCYVTRKGLPLQNYSFPPLPYFLSR